VLSFPLDLVDLAGSDGADGVDTAAAPGDAPLLAGDVVVCPEVARRQAPDHAGSFDDEVALLVVHGVLHLLGHDHAEPDERDRMQARERALLARFHGLLTRDPWDRS
jgi:probable rRNA maturation factor